MNKTTITYEVEEWIEFSERWKSLPYAWTEDREATQELLITYRKICPQLKFRLVKVTREVFDN